MKARVLMPLALRCGAYATALTLLVGCGKLKEMLSKTDDAGVDAAAVAAPPVVAPVVEDAAVDAGPVAPVAVDDIPSPADEDTRANRDIGFGNFKEELDKLEKEPDKK